MKIKTPLVAALLALGLTFGLAASEPAFAKDRKVIVKKKHKHHRHRVGLKHIGRGTKHKTVVKTSR